MSDPRVREPLRLGPADFDAYVPERATSNAFARVRLELKHRLLHWAGRAAARLQSLGIGLSVSGSDEHPSARQARWTDSQRVTLWRDPETRAELEQHLERSFEPGPSDPEPQRRHVVLGLRIDANRVEISLELHPDAWLDHRNLRARLAEPGAALELASELGTLPEPFVVGLAADADRERTPAGDVTPELLRKLADRSERLPSPIWIGWSIPRDLAVRHADLLDEQLEDALVALGPVYRLVAWSPENDFLLADGEWERRRLPRVRGRLTGKKGKRRGRDAGRPAGRDRRHTASDGRRATSPSSSRGSPDKKPQPSTKESKDGQEARPVKGRGHEPRHAKGKRAAAETKSELRPKSKPEKTRKERAPENRPLTRPSVRFSTGRPPVLKTQKSTQLRSTARRSARWSDVDARAPIEKGTRVRVLSGPFADKEGVVQELDGKGRARVLLGLLATRVELKELVAVSDGPGRAVLSSSHRKPIPAR